MKAFQFDRSENLGAIRRLWIADAVNCTGETSTDFSVQAYHFNPGGGFEEVYFTLETATYQAEGEPGRHGLPVSHSIPFFVPKMSVETLETLRRYEFRELIVVFEDMNGQRWTPGGYDSPLRFSFAFTTGDGVQGRNGYSFVIAGVSPDHPRAYEATLENALPAPPLPTLPDPSCCPALFTFEGNATDTVHEIVHSRGRQFVAVEVLLGWQTVDTGVLRISPDAVRIVFSAPQPGRTFQVIIS